MRAGVAGHQVPGIRRIRDPQHHLIVNLDVFGKSKLRQWFESLVAKVEAPDSAGVGEHLSRFGYGEYEDHGR